MTHCSALMKHYQFQRQITFSEHTCFVFLHCNHCNTLNDLNTAVLYSDQQWPNIPTFFHHISLLATKKKANYISELIPATSTPLTFKTPFLPQSTCMYTYIISGIEYFGEITQSSTITLTLILESGPIIQSIKMHEVYNFHTKETEKYNWRNDHFMQLLSLCKYHATKTFGQVVNSYSGHCTPGTHLIGASHPESLEVVM